MTKFSDLAILNTHHHKIENASCSVALESNGQKIALNFNTKDIIIEAAYEGASDPWLNVLCELLVGKTLNEALQLGWAELERVFKDDQFFWDLRTEQNEEIFFQPFELVRAALDIFRGRDYLYKDGSPLICRCFGIRESDVLEHLKLEATPTLDSLSGKTKAGMGCRTCVTQLTQLLEIHSPKKKTHFYKDRPATDWLLDIDMALKNFFEGADWNLEVQSFRKNQVVISFDKEVSQKEEEEMALALQRFMEVEVDPDLGFFLTSIRDLQRLKISR